MKRPRICAVVVDNDLEAIRRVNSLVDLFEVRIDIIGNGWQEIVKQLEQPWIACNRRPEEGGKWLGSEERRITELLQAVGLGAAMIDIELETRNLEKIAPLVKKGSKCLLSSHDLVKTSPLVDLKKLVQRQLSAGADTCKVATTANSFADNLTVMQLIMESVPAKIVSFAMGPLGQVSRVLSPLVGGDFTYASIEKGKESANGQMTVSDLRTLYGMVLE